MSMEELGPVGAAREGKRICNEPWHGIPGQNVELGEEKAPKTPEALWSEQLQRGGLGRPAWAKEFSFQGLGFRA